MTPTDRQLAVVEQGQMPTSPVLLKSWDDLMTRAEFLAKSQLIPQALRGKPADVAIVLQIGWELELPPMQAINGIDVIQGKPAISPQLGVAMCRARLPKFYMKAEEDAEKSEFRVTMARDRDRLDEAYTATWNDAKARALGLLDKPNYRSQKFTMYRWRATMEAIRVIAPDILKGLYSSDELEDIPSETPARSRQGRPGLCRAERGTQARAQGSAGHGHGCSAARRTPQQTRDDCVLQRPSA
jgi:hypothetical protein